MFRCLAGSLCLLGVSTFFGCDSAPAKDEEAAKPLKKSDENFSPNAWMQTDLTRPKKVAPIAPTPVRQDAPVMPPAKQPKSGPAWQCTTTLHDFGEVWAGATIEHRFEFQNVGTAPLIIPKPKAHCSCSSAPDWSSEVAPGQTGIIPFSLKTQNKFGPVQEYLDIETNDPLVPKTRVWMQGTVKTVCQCEVIEDAEAPAPEQLEAVKNRKGYFDKIKATDRLHRVVRMRNTSGAPLTLEMMPPAAVARQFKFDFKVVEPGQVFDLTIDGEPPFPVGRSGTSLIFRTNIPERRNYILPVVATVPERIEIIPNKIVADETSWQVKRRLIRINNNGSTPIKVTALAVSDPLYKIKLLEPDPKQPAQIQVEVLLPEGDYRPPPYGEVVRIETTDAEKAVIELMVLPSLTKPAAPRPADKPLTLHPAKG